MKNEPSWALLARYVSGTCSPEEVRRVEAWVRADPSREQLIEELRGIWGAAEGPPRTGCSSVDVEAGWQQVRAEMETSAPDGTETGADRVPEPQSPSRTQRRPARRRGAGWRVGAMAALLLLVGGLGIALWAGGSEEAASDSAYRTVTTEPGERSQLQLADGSTVRVNVDSELRLPAPFRSDRRVVQLTGEAYFDVEPDPDRPFIVQTETASVRVRGTAFNVRGYPDEDEVAVAVTEGGVSVCPQHDESEPAGVEVEPGEVGRTATADTTVQVRAANLDAHTGWTEGRLVFENAPLPEVARRLERWYDLDVRIRDPALRSLRLTASLKSQSVENVLDVITASLGIRYRIDQDSVLLGAREASP